MRVQAIYYHKDYNAFDEYHNGPRPYEIIANVPDDWTDEEIWNEANKPAAKKHGFFLKKCNKIVWNGQSNSYEEILFKQQ